MTGTKGFVLGAAAGAVVIRNWRLLVKEGVKLTVVGGAKVREAASRAVEELTDLAAEARSDLDARAAAVPDPVLATNGHLGRR